MQIKGYGPETSMNPITGITGASGPDDLHLDMRH